MAVIYRNVIDMEQQQMDTYDTFEHLELLLNTNNNCVRVCVIYRPPDTSQTSFLVEFETFLDSTTTKSGELLVVGDFNFHFESTSDPSTQNFHAMLDGMNMDQQVMGATHDKGHTLDLVITRQDESALVTDLTVCPMYPFDHMSISFTLPFKKPSHDRKKIKFRKINNIDTELLSQDLQECRVIKHPPSDLYELVISYNSDLNEIIEKHAPLLEKEVVLRPHAPWYTEHIQHAKIERRKAEQKWGKDKSTVNKEILKSKQKHVNTL